MKRRLVGFMPVCAALLAAPAPALAQDAPPPNPPLTQAENATAIDLYGKLHEQSGNLFFSPYSISAAMGMVFAGAKGDTATEIANALHLNVLGGSGNITKLQQDFLQATQKQPALGGTQSEGFTLHAANALWGQAGYKFNESYIESIKASFGGALRPVNFGDETTARNEINQWVSGQTQGKIPELIQQGVLTQDARLVLTNAIYFDADWATAFKPQDTAKSSFHVAPGNDVTTSMMSMTESFNLAQVNCVKILELPYRGQQASMIVVLPNDANGLASIETGLTVSQLNGWIAASQPTLVQLSLPKFKTSGAFDLNRVLKTLGINDAFSPTQADFKNIADDPEHPLYISSVIHQAFINVDETSTEAAAATAATMFEATAMAPNPVTIQPVPFIADHPFLYLIRDDVTGEILFMGRETDPTQ